MKLKDDDIQERLDCIALHACCEDNEGQLVFYTGIFEWSDGTFHNKPQADKKRK